MIPYYFHVFFGWHKVLKGLLLVILNNYATIDWGIHNKSEHSWNPAMLHSHSGLAHKRIHNKWRVNLTWNEFIRLLNLILHASKSRLVKSHMDSDECDGRNYVLQQGSNTGRMHHSLSMLDSGAYHFS